MCGYGEEWTMYFCLIIGARQSGQCMLQSSQACSGFCHKKCISTAKNIWTILSLMHGSFSMTNFFLNNYNIFDPKNELISIRQHTPYDHHLSFWHLILFCLRTLKDVCLPFHLAFVRGKTTVPLDQSRACSTIATVSWFDRKVNTGYSIFFQWWLIRTKFFWFF